MDKPKPSEVMQRLNQLFREEEAYHNIQSGMKKVNQMRKEFGTKSGGLSFEVWQKALIDVTCREAKLKRREVKLNPAASREQYDSDMMPFYVFRENFGK